MISDVSARQFFGSLVQKKSDHTNVLCCYEAVKRDMRNTWGCNESTFNYEEEELKFKSNEALAHLMGLFFHSFFNSNIRILIQLFIINNQLILRGGFGAHPGANI